MNNKSKVIIASQIVVVLAFFVVILFNYLTYFPLVNAGENFRLNIEIDDFCSKFYHDYNPDSEFSKSCDSLLSLDPYKDSDFLILDVDGSILFSKYGDCGDGCEVVSRKYGKLAVELLKEEIHSPRGKSRMDYDDDEQLSIYVFREPSSDLSFFYAVNYYDTSAELYSRLSLLLLVVTIGGLVIILVSVAVSLRTVHQFRLEFSVQRDLEMSALIQKSMMPVNDKQLLQIDLSATLVPAKKVAGDFFCYLLRNGMFYFCIGDVSGKGMPASLYMSKAMTLFRCCANFNLSVGEMVANMNQELCKNNNQNMFLTCLVGIMNPTNGIMEYVNAGHEYPVIWDGKNDSDLEFLNTDNNIPLGVIQDVEFKQGTYELEKNGMLFLYTDGVTDARNSRQIRLGRDNLLKVLSAMKSLSSREINRRLLNAVKEYETGTEQSDDITIFTFRNIPNPKTVVLKNEISELKKISPFIEDIFKECRLSRSREQILLRSALDEALTNCVRYAYDRPGGKIELISSIDTSSSEKKLCFTIKDKGVPFNPLEYSPEPSEELRVGGLGISMYTRIFDDVRYSRKDGYNILELIKTI